MANDYYNSSGYPAPFAPGASLNLRNELSNLALGFDKLPALSGAANRLVRVNATATALESFVDTYLTVAAAAAAYLQLAGGTMTGALTLSGSAGQMNVVPTSEAGIGLVAFKNAAGVRKLEILYAGTGSAGFYGVTPGAVGINANAGPLVLSTADTARLTIAASGYVAIANILGVAAAPSGNSWLEVTSAAGNNSFRPFRVWNSTNEIHLNPANIAGGFNALVQAGDQTLIYSAGASDTGSLVIGPASAAGGGKGIRIANTGGVTIAAPSSGAALAVNAVSGDFGVNINGAAGSFSAMRLLENSASKWLLTSGTEGAGIFSIYNVAAANSAVKILPAGNVTIAAPSSGSSLLLNQARGTLFPSESPQGIDFRLKTAAGGYGSWVTFDDTNGGFGVWHVGHLAGSNNFVIASGDPIAGTAVSRINVGSAGNVTIAAPSSGVALAVNGSETLASSGAVDLSVSASVAAVGAMAFGVNNSGATNAYGAPTGTLYTGSVLLPMVFTTSGAERMRIDSAGNVGIGTLANASTRLHVKSSAASNTFFETTTARGSGNNYQAWYDPTGRKGYMGYAGSTDALYFYNELNADISFATNATERLKITAAGIIQDAAGNELGYKGLPSASVTTGAFAAADRGKCVFATAGVTVPNSTMAAGDVVVIQNTTGAAITITATITTLRQTGTANTGNRTLAAYGRCAILFSSSTLGFISGDVT